VFVPEDAERLAARLRLSNAEQALLLLGAADHDKVKLPDEIAARRALYRLGPCKFEAHVLLASADEGAAPDDRLWRQALRLADRWQVPEFPVRGPDIMALGKVQGPEIGEMLRRLEAEWVASDFTLDRVALLARVKQLLQN
jgi:poly(A) polymerase